MIPLATEALPQARGVMLTTYIACLSVSRAIGTLLGGWMFRTGGIAMNGTIAMILSLVAAALLWRFVNELR
jgi:predicted MFS family arabinose efflux permease